MSRFAIALSALLLTAAVAPLSANAAVVAPVPTAAPHSSAIEEASVRHHHHHHRYHHSHHHHHHV
jgi:hypothetical protein